MSGKSTPVPAFSVAVRKGGMGPLKRLPVSDTPLNHIYKRVKTLDDGKGGLGGMNAGVYIVYRHDTRQHYVEKCYRSNNTTRVRLFCDEIKYMRVSPANRCSFPSLDTT